VAISAGTVPGANTGKRRSISPLPLTTTFSDFTVLQWRWRRIACRQQRSYGHLHWIRFDAEN